ncbi:MAG: efflux RND transporter periplasmic adaptor subunit [Proteobacteria bacterium]|nr:efflux RND transporter periplasmic adaptor subunit [Pseudomonadota bacterium]NOG61122.1 efflux RND transporter periplasmic adaptor subunit [Pseudomonadota bacterium]
MKVKKIFTFILTLCSFLVVFGAYAADDDLFSNGIVADNVRGLIKPVEKAIISSEIAGKIDSIPFKSGDAFKKGDVLVAFDCSFYRADLASAEAAYKSKQNIYENNKQLLALNAISDIDVSISKAEVDMARAERTMRAIRVNQCKIKAPYSGRVIEVAINEFETVPADKEILSILNDSQLEIELIVPSNWLNWLTVGESFSFLIDETGKTLEAKVSKTGAVVDPVSQTIKLVGKFESELDDVLSGMSGTAQFKQSNN